MSISPTLSHAATQAGILLGTAAYMSPEQARGKKVDRRADIWSFGATLCEMMTGKSAFAGETISDTLAAVIRAEPDWNALPGNVPASITRLLRRCLTKDPNQRLRDIGEARIALDAAISGNFRRDPRAHCNENTVAATVASCATLGPGGNNNCFGHRIQRSLLAR